jgi:chromosome segregation ATPase
MDATPRSDTWLAWLGAGVTAVVGVGTLLRRWRFQSDRAHSASEGVYVSGTKQAFDVLQQQITRLESEINDLRNRAGVFRMAELDYVGQIRKLEAQNWEQADEIEELKAQNKRQAEEMAELKQRLSSLERKTT